MGKHALDKQKDAMEAGLNYNGHNHETMVERLFQINGDLDLFGEDAEGYSRRDMAGKSSPRISSQWHDSSTSTRVERNFEINKTSWI